jgi:hypothetical protein
MDSRWAATCKILDCLFQRVWRVICCDKPTRQNHQHGRLFVYTSNLFVFVLKLLWSKQQICILIARIFLESWLRCTLPNILSQTAAAFPNSTDNNIFNKNSVISLRPKTRDLKDNCKQPRLKLSNKKTNKNNRNRVFRICIVCCQRSW